jgi:hypothetical protein
MATENKLKFEFGGKVKTWSLALTIIGLALGAVGFATDHSDHQQYSWSILLICAFFFFAISVGALFFYTLQYAAEVAWSSQIKRVFEAMYGNIFVFILIIGGVLLAGQLDVHHLWHWMDSSVYAPYVVESTGELTHDGTLAGAVANPDYDKIIADKYAYLNPYFFWGRYIAYFLVFVGFARYFRRMSLKEDEVGGLDIHYTTYRRSAVFLVFFAVFSSMISWDWLMSIDVHWFSTMYGWYIFSGMWVTTMIFATLLIVYLKNKGYFPKLNNSHIHDLGKWVFAVSMLWSYLWFCQYMLIWYSNIPEEVTYFQERYEHFMYPMVITFLVNFAVPFYVLIARDAKRNTKYLVRVGVIIFFGHAADLYVAVVPGTTHGHVHFTGWFEVGLFLGFLGLFTYLTLNALSKERLVPVNHPFLKESEQHQI